MYSRVSLLFESVLTNASIQSLPVPPIEPIYECRSTELSLRVPHDSAQALLSASPTSSPPRSP